MCSRCRIQGVHTKEREGEKEKEGEGEEDTVGGYTTGNQSEQLEG